MPYRSDLEALRQRITTLQREADEARHRLAVQETELRATRARARRSEARCRAARVGRFFAGTGTGTFFGLLLMLPVAGVLQTNIALLAFGAIVGGLFGLLLAVGSEIPPRR